MLAALSKSLILNCESHSLHTQNHAPYLSTSSVYKMYFLFKHSPSLILINISFALTFFLNASSHATWTYNHYRPKSNTKPSVILKLTSMDVAPLFLIWMHMTTRLARLLTSIFSLHMENGFYSSIPFEWRCLFSHLHMQPPSPLSSWATLTPT